uniref:Uncharacterized protein n=1 Tax=Glossina pallidipes TaxID=7398 RepID=A0A1B0A8B9_GLOPL
MQTTALSQWSDSTFLNAVVKKTKGTGRLHLPTASQTLETRWIISPSLLYYNSSCASLRRGCLSTKSAHAESALHHSPRHFWTYFKSAFCAHHVSHYKTLRKLVLNVQHLFLIGCSSLVLYSTVSLIKCVLFVKKCLFAMLLPPLIDDTEISIVGNFSVLITLLYEKLAATPALSAKHTAGQELSSETCINRR